MNIASKVFCRAFQFVFRAALPVLPYRDPSVFHRVSDVVPLLQAG